MGMCSSKNRAISICGGVKIKLQPFLTLTLGGNGQLLAPSTFPSKRDQTQTHLASLCGTESRSENGEEKNPCPCRKKNTSRLAYSQSLFGKLLGD
jgi:hypothetical protein